jgi:hypothetical protein
VAFTRCATFDVEAIRIAARRPTRLMRCALMRCALRARETT